ncbi:hypothetical protein [uncultured Bifidobacterium sp.]|uniref:hypothetical protein n=1 Tax=uncultured Bifidobacterium sp. TaxID=165187 RepID=UPI00259746D4|nr:hypothetical protein [uncultured Bifidobacterium sp.]
MTQSTTTTTTRDAHDPRKPDILLWIDVETTALDPDDGQLLEVGMLATDTNGEPIHHLRTWLIGHDAIDMTPTTSYAIGLHARNGLIEQTFKYGQYERQVARDIDRMLTALADGRTLHPAGTNVDFDLRWLCLKLDLKLEQLDYHRLDMSSLRILMGQACLGAYAHATTDHRVASCIDRDLTEYKAILEAFAPLTAGSRHDGEGKGERCR